MSDRREHAPGLPSEEGMSRLQRTASRVQHHVARRLVIESNRDLSKTVLLAGTGRSGTTWVSNILLAGGGGRYLFEPFHSRRVSACSGFRYRQYLSPDAEEPELSLVADQILRGAIRDPWIDQLNRTVLAKWRLAKDIRANLMLGWLARLFPAVRVVVVVRHPAPVALSKLALDWGTPVDELVQQDALMRDHLEPYRGVLEAAKTPLQKHVALWCVETLVPLRSIPPGRAHLTFYEELCRSPEESIDAMRKHAGRSTTQAAQSAWRRPSELSRGDTRSLVSGEERASGWKNKITGAQSDEVHEILEGFGMADLYDDEVRPRRSAFAALRG